MEVQVDELCLKALALQHPVASDLRLIRSVIKANTDLERVGDQAVNVFLVEGRDVRHNRGHVA